MEPTITPGTVLDGPSILALCRARDLGVAAGTGDPGNPPEILQGVESSRWPQLVVAGRQAVTDMVASVLPMVYAQTRRTPNAADTRGQMFVELMVKEQDVRDVRAGATGEVAFASKPGTRFAVKVERVEPMAVPRPEGNMFLVRCTLADKNEAWWRPGMSGAARIDAGPRAPLWIATHETLDYLRMRWW